MSFCWLLSLHADFLYNQEVEVSQHRDRDTQMTDRNDGVIANDWNPHAGPHTDPGCTNSHHWLQKPWLCFCWDRFSTTHTKLLFFHLIWDLNSLDKSQRYYTLVLIITTLSPNPQPKVYKTLILKPMETFPKAKQGRNLKLYGCWHFTHWLQGEKQGSEEAMRLPWGEGRCLSWSRVSPTVHIRWPRNSA